MTCFANADTSLVLNARPITGLSNSQEAVKLTYPKNTANVVEGMHGASQINLLRSSRVNVEIEVFASHPDRAWLDAINGLMRQGKCIKMNIALMHLTNGEGGTSDNGALVKAGDKSWGTENEGVRLYMFEFTDWVELGNVIGEAVDAVAV